MVARRSKLKTEKTKVVPMSSKWSITSVDGRFILQNTEFAFDLDTEDEAIDLEGYLFANSYGPNADDAIFLFDEWSYAFTDSAPVALDLEAPIYGCRRITDTI
jgi:hypothetical protein